MRSGFLKSILPMLIGAVALFHAFYSMYRRIDNGRGSDLRRKPRAARPPDDPFRNAPIEPR